MRAIERVGNDLRLRQSRNLRKTSNLYKDIALYPVQFFKNKALVKAVKTTQKKISKFSGLLRFHLVSLLFF